MRTSILIIKILQS